MNGWCSKQPDRFSGYFSTKGIRTDFGQNTITDGILNSQKRFPGQKNLQKPENGPGVMTQKCEPLKTGRANTIYSNGAILAQAHEETMQ
jgi:hypothetical protein